MVMVNFMSWPMYASTGALAFVRSNTGTQTNLSAHITIGYTTIEEILSDSRGAVPRVSINPDGIYCGPSGLQLMATLSSPLSQTTPLLSKNISERCAGIWIL